MGIMEVEQWETEAKTMENRPQLIQALDVLLTNETIAKEFVGLDTLRNLLNRAERPPMEQIAPQLVADAIESADGDVLA